ncbi:aldehyde dehydrogenase family protein [Mesomycoplasma molare]|uniref:Aldehyde dehydrogenase n=1 Tax=Mesomycoplasma molare TaxID=171288 RepID=A0ABY5TUJ3_9BACT|nr:aldehyde dehydrogenase family protein [Mesomycoplasma molare]UWD34004.1 aldehyde dehydrogenase family protein [Mesomycoplasma molare]
MNIKIKEIFQTQKQDFLSNGALSIERRIGILKKIKMLLKSNKNLIEEALYIDLGKTPMESFYSELALIFNSINLAIKSIKKWSKKKKINTPWFLWPSKSYIEPQAYGVVGIYSTWNYPFLLTLDPLIAAISAGNRVMLKISEYSTESEKLIKRLINENFQNNEIYCIENSEKNLVEFNEFNFDLIFFTGSNKIGKIIAKKAAENLTPVVLELGGKSPTIIFEDANLKKVVNNVFFGKFSNAGQICIAHDFIFIDEKNADKFINLLKLKIEKDFMKLNNKIINKHHFDRLINLVPEWEKENIRYDVDKMKIYPFIFKSSLDDKIMKEEIFGPILPIITFKDNEDLIKKMSLYNNPLVLYLFTQNKKNIEITKKISSGNLIINDTIVFLSNYFLPFGGIKESGNGKYHGYEGFKTFSHFRSVFKNKRSKNINPYIK